jgi:hypothetical protein
MWGFLRQMLVVLWAAPWTLLGLAIGLVALASGGGMQRVGGVIEFHGGAVGLFLRRFPLVRGAAAMTLGHMVLGQTPADLERCRAHELAHVRQYERWGPLFIPAYLLCSLVQGLRGKDPYLDNPFERQAYREAP